MYKRIIAIILMLFSFSFLVENVSAADIVLASTNNQETCDYVLGPINDKNSLAHFLQDVFNLIKYAGPVLCIALSVIEFIKAIASQDKDALIKATQRTLKRLIYALILFFIPGLINFFFELLGWTGTCGIS